MASLGAPATNPDVRSRTRNVRPTESMVPETSASHALAAARSAALMPPGKWAAVSWTLGGAAALNPNATSGRRPAKL